MERILNNKKGITLVALVITIVILIIISGVTLAMLLTPNGLTVKSSAYRYRSVIWN